MFFLKKTKPIKNKLPDKLVSLKHALEPSWVWDYEYRIIVWSNIAGLKFWNVDTREEIKELIFPENNSMVTTCDLLAKKLNRGGIISEVITFPTRPTASSLKCDLSKQELPDGRYGVLITVRPPVVQQQPTVTAHQNETPLSSQSAYNHNNPTPEHTDNSAHKSDSVYSLDMPIHAETEDTLGENNNNNIVSQNIGVTDQKKSQLNLIMLTKPATFTCDNNGLIVGNNEITQSILNIKEGDNCCDLFIDKNVAPYLLERALNNPKLSFVQKIDIGYGLLPYLLQTTQFKLHEKPHFNMGILQISEEKYQDFLNNSPDNVVTQIPQKSASTLGKTPSQESPIDKKHISLSDDKYLSSSLIGDMTGIGLFNVKKDGIIKAVNQMASNLMGCTQDELVGKNIIYMFGSDATNVLKELIINNNNAVLHDLEHGVRCQYEDVNRIEHIAKLVVRPNHADNGFWFVLNDMTELEKIKNELSDLKSYKHDNVPAVTDDTETIKMTKNTQIPQFVNAVSHEIRAPLNAIAGYAEMIESEMFGALPDIRYKEFAQSIRGAGEYALSIIGELLDYSKLKSGGFTPQFAPVDIDKIASEAIETVYPQALARKIEIVKTILTGTPLVNSDARLLKQILINLLTNAIKYSTDGEQILLTAGLTKTGRVMLEITDFGRGMTKQEIHDALIPFNRGNQPNDMPGTGLGLSLSKELTELTHGRFMIDSVPNEKTRVRIIYEKTSLLN